MMPYTQISTCGDNQFPSTLCFGTQGGDPGGGSTVKTKPKKAAKKAPAKKKK
jgi:hypothetical protein